MTMTMTMTVIMAVAMTMLRWVHAYQARYIWKASCEGGGGFLVEYGLFCDWDMRRKSVMIHSLGINAAVLQSEEVKKDVSTPPPSDAGL
ncbi:hypothetical protein K504DRAFT_142268 [Pleomassaria siparia CBS 279.74]|uniref:Secreted protein n=1 Tax=Pleomassaria siparia CBS 279.74 TaxID=1314801 RepID=A0A6G1KLV5_9PLEO|nr:hypothetical protein K504DRAFT_142268 [Pleomassaria siparia CBS 279.74]